MADDFPRKVRRAVADAYGTVPHPSEELQQAYIAVCLAESYGNRDGVMAAFKKFEKLMAAEMAEAIEDADAETGRNVEQIIRETLADILLGGKDATITKRAPHDPERGPSPVTGKGADAGGSQAD